MNPAPRLSIFRLGSGGEGEIDALLEALERRGHRILPIPETPRPWDEWVRLIEEAEMILLNPAKGELSALITTITPYVRPRQIIAHTSPTHGAIALNGLYLKGAVTGRIIPVAGPEAVFRVEGADDLARASLEILVLDAGAKVFHDDADTLSAGPDKSPVPDWLLELWEAAGTADPQGKQELLRRLRAEAERRGDETTLAHLRALEQYGK